MKGVVLGRERLWRRRVARAGGARRAEVGRCPSSGQSGHDLAFQCRAQNVHLVDLSHVDVRDHGARLGENNNEAFALQSQQGFAQGRRTDAMLTGEIAARQRLAGQQRTRQDRRTKRCIDPFGGRGVGAFQEVSVVFLRMTKGFARRR